MKYIILTVVFSLVFTTSLHANKFNVISNTAIDDLSDEQTGLKEEVLQSLESADYSLPNERSPHVYESVLRDRAGILISVGTIRALIGFSLSNQFDRLIMLDVAKPILNFNRKHLEFIRELSFSHESLTDQRARYIEEYNEYLKVFHKSGSLYYWESDAKWQKITTAINDGKIHVIRGNFGRLESCSLLLDIVRELKTSITLDHSNLFQYVNDNKTQYAEVIEAFRQAALNEDLAVLATTQYYTSYLPYDETHRIFAINVDPSRKSPEDGIQWVYYYFPCAKAYLNYIDRYYYDKNRIGEISLEDWQVDKVADYAFIQIQESGNEGGAVIIEAIENYLNAHSSPKLYWPLPLPLSEISKNKVWQKIYEKIFGHALLTDSIENCKDFISKWCDEKTRKQNESIDEFWRGFEARADDFYSYYRAKLLEQLEEQYAPQ